MSEFIQIEYIAD